jgi:uncharacterized protein YukE
LGLTSDLRRINHHKILAFRLRVEEGHLKRKYQSNTDFIHQKVEPLKAHLVVLIDKIVELETELAALKAKKLQYVTGKYQAYKHQLQAYLATLKIVQQELNFSLSTWKQL